MSWAHDYWYDRAEMEAEAGQSPAAPLPINLSRCADCPSWEPRAKRLYEQNGAIVCSKHAAKRARLRWETWTKRRRRARQGKATGATSGPMSSSASKEGSGQQ